MTAHEIDLLSAVVLVPLVGGGLLVLLVCFLWELFR